MDVPAAAQAQDAPPELDALYILSQLFTWVLLALNGFELFTGYGTPSFIASTLNFTALSAYAGHRQVVKWRDPEMAAALPSRKGENFVVIWGVFFLVAKLAVTYVGPFDLGNHHIQLYFPHELLAIFLEVISVFTGTKISTSLRMPIGKAVPGTSGAGDDPASTPDAAHNLIEAATQLIVAGALPHDGKWYSHGEVLKQARLKDETTQSWAIRVALNALVKAGQVEKQAKGPRDPYTKYRWKQGSQ